MFRRKQSSARITLCCMMLLVIFLFILVTIIVSFSAIELLKRHSSLKELKNSRKKNVLFVTAHPDDECMFFAPSILNMPQHNKYLLCLSNGDFYSTGSLRSEELVNSSKVLGIKKDHVFIHSHHDLQDDPAMLWNATLVSEVVEDYVNKHHIDVLITFDEHGVSGHLNHIGTYEGVRHYLQSHSDVVGYKLVTVDILRKYSSFFDISWTFLSSSLDVFVSNPVQVLMAQSAMRQHKSQMVWFRRLYIWFSRYMFVNDFLPLH